jgi:predicted CopG family antitoxin
MGTKTIGIKEDVYRRLKAHKRADESFTDVVDRLLDETKAEWRDGFGTLATNEADELERAVKRARKQASAGLADRQQKALEEMVAAGDTDETA